MEDQFVLTYVKRGVMYPVSLNKDQDYILQTVVPGMVSEDGKILILKDYPLGEAVFINPKKGEV